MIDALSPLDGRYAEKTESLRLFFSEEALTKYRLVVEVSYFMALGDEKSIRDLPKLNKAQITALEKLIEDFDGTEAKKVKTIERTTNHDVKAVEYYLKQRMEKIGGLKKYTEFVHFGLTSEDVNNLAYGMMIHDALQHVVVPDVKRVLKATQSMAKKWAKVPMLSLTHGQPATPSTVGEQFAVFAERLEAQLAQLQKFRMNGKFGGAVGNYSAHSAAYPEVQWEMFGKKYVKSLGMTPLQHTTQINPHDDVAELAGINQRINMILIDMSRDLWLYIMRGIFKQKVIAGEVGSSTMPHKVNPIDFENAEGNLGISNTLWHHFAEKLPISRMQRDLSDSTVQRNLGVAFGYQAIAFAALMKGFSKIELNKAAVQHELDTHPEVYAEAIQMVLRKHGIAGYEELKKLTRGAKVTKADLVEFVDGLKLPEAEKKRLKHIMR